MALALLLVAVEIWLHSLGAALLVLPLYMLLLGMLAVGIGWIVAALQVYLRDTSQVLTGLRSAGHHIEVLFLDAPDEILIRRFSETRRRHPLAGSDIRAGLLAERKRLSTLRHEATTVIDTGDLTVHGLRGMVLERYGRADGNLAVSILSFGFKYGLPGEADIVLDVRFLPNPFFVEALSPLSGEDEAVRRFVLENPETQLFLSKAEELLTLCIAAFEREGKSYATVAIGCTGGRHRSVVVGTELSRRLLNLSNVTVRHRDIQRGRPGAP